MTLVKRNSNLSNLSHHFDDPIVKNFFNYRINNLSNLGSSSPMANIIDTDSAFEIYLAAPGMTKKDFQIELDNEILKVSVEQDPERNKVIKGNYIRREYNYQSFQRSFHLSKEIVDGSKIEANYKNGILKIIIPKKEEAKTFPPRSIQIK